ncbi:MAG: hypothetical protein ACSHYA_16935 [Opitutaceae bacterium]
MKSLKLKITTSIVAALCLFSAGCGNETQTTSGKDYLSKFPANPTGAATTVEQTINAEVAEVASVEPLLSFPARIGLAKIYNGAISNLSEAEAIEWENAKAHLGSDFGEFVPVSPLIAEMVYTPRTKTNANQAAEVVRKIRLGAARQHLDAVLIYEVFSKTSKKTLASSVAAWTIIGAYIVPSHENTTVAHANALLIDVRNGYPYGTASADAKEVDLSLMINQYNNRVDQQNKAQVAAALKLIPEVTQMFETLKSELK